MSGIIIFLIIGIFLLAKASTGKNAAKDSMVDLKEQYTKKQNQTRKEMQAEKKHLAEKQRIEKQEQLKAKQQEEERAKEKRRREIRQREELRKKKMEEEERKDSILERSSKAVEEDFSQDVLEMEKDKHENCTTGHYEESEEFMKKVQDLMVMGPNCSISYERDFIAEGDEFLTSLGRTES